MAKAGDCVGKSWFGVIELDAKIDRFFGDNQGRYFGDND